MEKITNQDMTAYRTYVFDCDGVLLDSNQIKSEAFFEVALPYGKRNADRLVNYHQENGGISRFKKFRYFSETILNKPVSESEIKRLLKDFGKIVRQRLLSCNETAGMREFIQALPQSARKIVVSGGIQEELREVFARRGLDKYFDAIYGSPDTKFEILSREQEAGLLNKPAVFFGDSKLDYEAAKTFGHDFIFVNDYTEFHGWQNYFRDRRVEVVNNLGALLFPC